jgi:hypothetical protein
LPDVAAVRPGARRGPAIVWFRSADSLLLTEGGRHPIRPFQNGVTDATFSPLAALGRFHSMVKLM